VFGEFRHDDAGSKTNKSFAVGADPSGYYHDGNFDFWAAGVVQNLEPAAMDLYLIYRHADGDITNVIGDTANLDSFDMVIGGALIKF
jgi:hypothetical protein